MKKILLSILTAAMLLMPQAGRAQEAHSAKQWKPYGFVQLQGGMGTTFTNIDACKLASPTLTAGVGYMAIPELGLRYNINGMWSKGGFRNVEDRYHYNYIDNDFDVLFNLTNLLSKDKMQLFNLYFVAGLGVDYAWNNDIANLDLTGATEDHSNKWGNDLVQKDYWGTNFRLGLMGDVRLNSHWNVGAEVDMNPHGDDFNSKFMGRHSRDWMLTAQVSVTYKFWKGGDKVVEPKPVSPVKPDQPKVVRTQVKLDKNLSGSGNYRVAEYETMTSASSKKMLDEMAAQIRRDCEPYIQQGGKVDVIFTGSADAIPVTSVIKYNGEDVHDLPVNVQGVPVAMTLTQAGGINTNEQLALARALKAKDYVYQSVPGLKTMNATNLYNVKVSDERGVEYRTVDVEFIFYGK